MVGKCKLCGKELKNKRACHGHLITQHSAEYRAAGLVQANFIDYIDDLQKVVSPNPKAKAQAAEKEKGVLLPGNKPRGLRHLNLEVPAEARAHHEIDDEYGEHFEYIDDDSNVYTQAELIKRGWL